MNLAEKFYFMEQCHHTLCNCDLEVIFLSSQPLLGTEHLAGGCGGLGNRKKMDYNPRQSAMLREVSFVTQYFYLLIFVWPHRVPYKILVPEAVTEPTPRPLRSGITES